MDEKFDLQTALDLLQGRMEPEKPKKTPGSFLFQLLVAAFAAWLLWQLFEALKKRRPFLPGRKNNGNKNNTNANGLAVYSVSKDPKNGELVLTPASNCNCKPRPALQVNNLEPKTVEDLKKLDRPTVDTFLKSERMDRTADSSGVHKWTNHNLQPLHKNKFKLNSSRAHRQ